MSLKAWALVLILGSIVGIFIVLLVGISNKERGFRPASALDTQDLKGVFGTVQQTSLMRFEGRVAQSGLSTSAVLPRELAEFNRLAELNVGQTLSPLTNDRGHVFLRSADGKWQSILDQRGRLLKVRRLWGGSPEEESSAQREIARQANLPWTQTQAVTRTQALMEGLGYHSAILRMEYEAEPWRQATNASAGKLAPANGITVPFHVVRCYDTNDILLIQAEYQAGPGKIQLIGWFNNFP